ncbi:MAG TPA: TonB-dependent receptor [Woeseiaceae bacterium]|nr:TonB-dependent receptor [Woeseiaceae bacterium]
MKHWTGIALAVVTTLLVLPQAYAQDKEKGSSALEEITVTAQRREQSTMDVPISISAFGEQVIQQDNMKGAADYLLATPNVSYVDSPSQGSKGVTITMRGISDLQTDGERVSATSAFGIYVDELSTATAARGTSNPPLYDVQRIEVLRGPQGTYFGRSATGGAINITTNKPTDEFFAQLDLGAASFDTYEVAGIVNLPVTDTFSLRAVMQTETSGGQVKNVSPDSDGGDSGYDNQNMRVSARWDINDQWQVDFSANGIRENNDMQNTVSVGIQSRFGGDLNDPWYTCGLSFSVDDKACRDTTGFTDLQDEIYNLRVSYIGEKIGFKSITGHTTNSMDQLFDLDQSGRAWVNRRNDYDAETVSEEIRFFNVNADRFEWTVGALAYQDELVANNKILILDFLGPWMAGDYANENQINMDRDGWAVYGDLTWHISDAWSISLGGRYSDDNEQQDWKNVYAACANRAEGDPLDSAAGCELRPDQLYGPLPVINGRVTGGRRAQTIGTFAENSDTDFSPRLAVNWAINDEWNAYGIVSQGYKPAGARANPDSGGVNSSVYDKEKLTNYEIGVKAQFNEGRTRLNAAVFSMIWDDFQTTIRETFCREPDGTLRPQQGNENCEFVPLDLILNAPEASSKGVELSLETLVGDDWLFAFNYGYLDAEYDDFSNAIVGGQQVDLSGYPLPNSPENTAAASGTYNFDWGNASAYVRLEANYRDSVFNQDSIADPLFGSPPLTPDAFWLLNLRAGLEWDTQRLTFGVFNLLDEDYAAGAGSGSAGVVVVPREPVLNIKWTVWTN